MLKKQPFEPMARKHKRASLYELYPVKWDSEIKNKAGTRNLWWPTKVDRDFLWERHGK